MKKVMKQPFFWAAVGSGMLAILIAIISSVWHPEVSVLKELEKGINKGDAKKISSCFASADDAVNLEDFDIGLEPDKSIHIISGPVVTDEDGNLSVQVFVIDKINNLISYVESDTVDLVDISGKLYLEE